VKTCPLFLIYTSVFLLALPSAKAGGLMDTLVFGNRDSEQQHQVQCDACDVIKGGLDEPARRLLPSKTESWEGGHISFLLNVDPDKPTYVTIRLWGSDTNSNRLILFCEGKQIGYRHLGDVDLLDFGSDSDAPGYNGRFFYNTSPLPVSMTKGRTNLHFEVRSIGRIWPYGTAFAQYQKPMTEPTRGLYRLYTHTDAFFVPPADEKQGKVPGDPPVRKEPGPEVLDQLKLRINHEINGLLAADKPLTQMQMQFLARAYHVKWSAAWHNQRMIEKVIDGLDHIYVAYRQNPRLAESDPATPNPDWFGLGPSGDVVRLLIGPLTPHLDEDINDGVGGKVKRRDGFSAMLQASRDWHRRHRRLYTNQSMITDLYIYLANRGIAVLEPAKALTEPDVRHYLYESVGLQPWLGSDTDNGPAKPVGDNYYQLTDKGLTKELGFVGYYGEVLDWVTQIYDATRPDPGQPGDKTIASQLEKIAHTRAVFRYPMLDADGNRAMRAETIIGWRDAHYPGEVTYGERVSWDGSALYAVAATLDPEAVGYAQQMFSDNQFFKSVEDRMKDKSLRVTAELLEVPDQYELLKAQPPSSHRVPMTAGRPDFVWADEEDGVVALKHGDEMLYASLYWRARNAINFLARTHYIVPRFDRIAVSWEKTEFEPSGLTFTRPDWVNFGFGGGGLRYPGDLHSALAGEELPIAKIPEGVRFRPGDENVYAGKGSFYTLRYGPFLIGMNMTKDKTYELSPPAGVRKAQELVSGKRVVLRAPLKVAPRSTIVLCLEKET